MDRTVISENQANFFNENGYFALKEVLLHEELNRLQNETMRLIENASQFQSPDYMYSAGHRSGSNVLQRIEYVIEKSDACKNLLGHPFILESVEKLIGPDFIPTWDSMVIKMPDEGIAVPWHRDAGTDCVGDAPIFNVDFYLDDADENTCVWVMPGSHLWSERQTAEWLAERRSHGVTRDDFIPEGAVPAFMKPGDVLLHNILVLHGSPANEGGKLRRVIYYEFRAAHVEESLGPHLPEYIPLKQKMLMACIRHRLAAPYISTLEEAFVYAPPAPYNRAALLPDENIPTYRYPHSDFWRKAS